MIFWFRHRVQFFETDAMGVMHHTDTIRMLEQARVDWMNQMNWMKYHVPEGELCFAVTDVQVKYLASAQFNQRLRVGLVGQARGARLSLSHGVYRENDGVLLAEAVIHLGVVNDKLRPTRLPKEISEQVNKNFFDLVDQPFRLRKEQIFTPGAWPLQWPLGE